jgi:hypothetical protein
MTLILDFTFSQDEGTKNLWNNDKTTGNVYNNCRYQTAIERSLPPNEQTELENAPKFKVLLKVLVLLNKVIKIQTPTRLYQEDLYTFF